jgi:hypothetical protein
MGRPPKGGVAKTGAARTREWRERREAIARPAEQRQRSEREAPLMADNCPVGDQPAVLPPDEKMADLHGGANVDLTRINDELVRALKENEFPAEDLARMISPEASDVLMKALLTNDYSAINFLTTLTPDQQEEELRNVAREQIALSHAYSFSQIRETVLINLAATKARMAQGCPAEDSSTPLTADAVHEMLVKAKGRNRSIIVPPADDLAVLTLVELLCMCRDDALPAIVASHTNIQIRQDAAESITALLDNFLPVIRVEQENYLARPEDDRPPFAIGTLRPSHEHSRDFIELIDLASVVLRHLRDADYLLNPSAVPAFVNKSVYWKSYAEYLAKAFAATVRWIGDDAPQLANATYRFLEAIIPLVTGEEPSADSIRLSLARRGL